MTKIELELERYAVADDEAPHVQGSIRVASGSPTPFVGWVALLALLEEAATSLAPGQGALPSPAQQSNMGDPQ